MVVFLGVGGVELQAAGGDGAGSSGEEVLEGEVSGILAALGHRIR